MTRSPRHGGSATSNRSELKPSVPVTEHQDESEDTMRNVEEDEVTEVSNRIYELNGHASTRFSGTWRGCAFEVQRPCPYQYVGENWAEGDGREGKSL